MSEFHGTSQLLEMQRAVLEIYSVAAVTNAVSFVLVVTLCRRGNDSQRAVRFLETELKDLPAPITLQDVAGGLYAWARSVDSTFPVY